MRNTLFSLCLAITSLSIAQQTSVLFIGNSYTYTNDLPNTFRQLALSLDDTVTVASSAPGGYTFSAHTTNATTQAAIHQQAWDYVVLQEQSQIPSFPQSQVETDCYPFAAQLVDSIRANDDCTEPVFFMTWGRQNGDAGNCGTWPPVCTYEGMQAQLRTSYLNMAEANDATCSPVGIAWKHVREAYPQLNLYVPDGSHPSVAGTYVIANTMYATLFRGSTVGAAFTMGLAADTAAFIQQIASATVLDSLATWNIGVNDPDASFTFTENGGGNYQFNHGGGGTHQWTFSDGGSSSEADPLHHFLSSGIHTITHVYTDVCGRSDSAALEVQILITGIGYPGCSWVDGPIDVWCSGQELQVVSTKGVKGELLLYDLRGELIQRFVVRDERHLLSMPTGLFAWRFQAEDGQAYTGKGICLDPFSGR